MNGTSKNLKALIIGDTGVGKTAIRSQFIHHRFYPRTKHTIGADFQSVTLDLLNEATGAAERVTLQIWDTAGQERFHSSLGEAFFRGCDVCLLVFDLSNSESLVHTAKWQKKLLSLGRIENPSSFPVYLVGNKADLHQRAITEEQGTKAAQILSEIALDMERETAEAPILQPPQMAKTNLPTFLGSNSIKARLKALERQRSKLDNDGGDRGQDDELEGSVELATPLSAKASLLSFPTRTPAPSLDSDCTHSQNQSDDDIGFGKQPQVLVKSYPYFEVSAKTGHSVHALFLHIAKNVKPTSYSTIASTIQLDYATDDQDVNYSTSNCNC